MKKPVILKQTLLANYTVTNAYTNVPSLALKVPESGYYFIYGGINGQVVDNNGPTSELWVKLAINDKRITASGGYNTHGDGANAQTLRIVCVIHNTIYLKKDDIINVSVRMDTGDNTLILATSEYAATYMEAIKIG